MNNERSYLRGALIGALGFSLSAIIGDFASYMLFRSNLIGIVLDRIGEGQELVGLYTAIFMALTIIALGAGIGGAIGGLSLSYVNPTARRRQYVLGSGFAFAVGQGLLIIPILLLLSVIAMYNNGPRGRPLDFIIIFAILGVVYGLVCGVVLSLMTVRFRHTWRVILASTFGFGIGGSLIGYLVYWAQLSAVRSFSIGEIIFLFLALALGLNVPGGAVLGLAYNWIARKSFSTGDESVQPARVQQIVVVVASVLSILVLTSFKFKKTEFLTSRPSSTATELPSKTVGVDWGSSYLVAHSGDPETLQSELYAGEGDQVAIVWVKDTGVGSDIFYVWNDPGVGGDPIWSNPVNVSMSPDIISSQPGIVSDRDGNVHIVWTEAVNGNSGDTAIAYSRCQGEECSLPQTISSLDDLECAAYLPSAGGERHLNPAIAVDEVGTIMVAWDAGSGVVPYTTWPGFSDPPSSPSGCVLDPDAGAGLGLSFDLRLAGGAQDEFVLVYAGSEAGQSGEIYLLEYDNGGWGMDPELVGEGTSPEVFIDPGGQVHVAWCDAQAALRYLLPAGEEERIDFPGCSGRPGLGQDSEGLMHLVWYADHIEQVGGEVQEASLVYESIRIESGWSEAAIVAQTAMPAQPAVASADGKALHMVWGDDLNGDGVLFYARQDHYACDPESLSESAQQVLQVMEAGIFRPPEEQVPFCGNQYKRIVYTPNPQVEFSEEEPSKNGAFDKVSEMVTTAEYEVLFTTMQWEPDEYNLSPGTVLSEAVADLYRQIKEEPERYPRGMTVRILLGNYPELSNFEWGDQIWSALEDFREAGVEEMANPDIGWKLEVANFSGTYPHSHSKFLIVDGREMLAAGFNYGYLHFSQEHPSHKGDDLVDLGIQITGPVAQAGLLTYDDLWIGANGVHCENFYPEDPDQWKDTCSEWKGTTEHVPEVLKYYLPGGDDNAFSLFRSGVYKEADIAVAEAIASAEESLDIVHVNFSLELICAAAVIDENICSYDDALPYMEAIMTAVEQNNARVRVMVEQSNMNGLENRVGMLIFKEELEKRGLSEHVELRFYNGRLHAKSMLIDDELLIIGSQNFHYSAWGEGGLTEYSLATDSPAAIEAYQDLFEYQWERSLSSDTAWSNSSK